MVHIIGFDPGGITGWARFTFWPEAFSDPKEKILMNVHSFAFGEISGSEDRQVDEMIGIVEAWPTSSDIIVEDFILREFRRGRELLSPVRITASFKYAVRWVGLARRGKGREGGGDNPRLVILQQPSLAKTCMTDQRLKDAGYYECTSGNPHARDAVRHVLTWSRRKKEGYNFV